MASGREDIDVRMLGLGRPFAIELCKPRRADAVDRLRDCEARINEQDLIQVLDLRVVSKYVTSGLTWLLVKANDGY